MKGRTGQSPDLADAAALVVEMARRLGAGNLTGQSGTDKRWDELTKKFGSVYDSESLYTNAEVT